MASPWTLLGPHVDRPRPNYLSLALSLIFAWPVMGEVPERYPLYMVGLAIIVSTGYVWLGVRAHAAFALLFIPIALLWLNPLLGMEWFNHQGPMFFLAHAAMALLFGVAGYTYMASEKQ